MSRSVGLCWVFLLRNFIFKLSEWRYIVLRNIFLSYHDGEHIVNIGGSQLKLNPLTRTQFPLTKEYTLNHNIKAPII